MGKGSSEGWKPSVVLSVGHGQQAGIGAGTATAVVGFGLWGWGWCSHKARSHLGVPRISS